MNSPMTLQTVGLLSPGDMGHVVGRLLVGHGLRVVTCLEGRSDRTRTLAGQASIEAVPTYQQLVQQSELILSIVVPAEAENTARTVARALETAGESTVYVDCNAVSPSTVQKIGGVIGSVGSQFVDASIIGPPPTQPGKTRFYASGPNVEPFRALAGFGLDVRPIGLEIGQASGLKMTYAAFTKGLFAIATELLVAARAMGLYEALVEEFQLSQSTRYQIIAQALPAMPTKSRRWIGEMQQIANTFADLGLTPKMYEGAAEMYQFVGKSSLADETPETLNKQRTLSEVIEILATDSGIAVNRQPETR
jgi:3-hydroxyisobutyrate dehydrogenase-like beta-hydroxyacid dehydrogenase